MGYNFTAATKLLEYSVFKVTGNHIPLNKWQYLKNGERQRHGYWYYKPLT